MRYLSAASMVRRISARTFFRQGKAAVRVSEISHLIVFCCPPDQVPDAPRNDAASNDLPDIEELCTMCDALPIGSPVTSFPIKAERKKAREEVDIVNVVEWRHPSTQARWFLLIRRPEGGQ